MLFENRCVKSCGDLIEFNGNCFSSCSTCTKCPERCRSCQNELTCETCLDSYTLANKTCVPEYCTQMILKADNNIPCPTCGLDCAECELRNEQIECLKCSSDLYLHNGSCVSFCPLGYSPELSTMKCILKPYYLI